MTELTKFRIALAVLMLAIVACSVLYHRSRPKVWHCDGSQDSIERILSIAKAGDVIEIDNGFHQWTAQTYKSK